MVGLIVVWIGSNDEISQKKIFAGTSEGLDQTWSIESFTFQLEGIETRIMTLDLIHFVTRMRQADVTATHFTASKLVVTVAC